MGFVMHRLAKLIGRSIAWGTRQLSHRIPSPLSQFQSEQLTPSLPVPIPLSLSLLGLQICAANQPALPIHSFRVEDGEAVPALSPSPPADYGLRLPREKWEGSNSGRRVYFRPSEVRALLARVVIGT